MTKTILITGNLGYVGSELCKFLKKKEKKINLIGLDVGYFIRSKVIKYNFKNKTVDEQIYCDIRSKDYQLKISKQIDVIIHLAAISNDPLGSSFKKPTKEINTKFSKSFINWAIKKGVKKFIFASSCSVYGYSDKICHERSKTNPLTEYAKSKVEIENYLKKVSSKNFKTIALRFSTACGASDMLRLDLVLNDFVANAIAKNEIKLLSNGEAIRPLIDVVDMCKAIYWAINFNRFNRLCINVGSEKMNFKIKDLALKVKKYLKKSRVTINFKNKDFRSYRVNFSKFKKLYKGYSTIKNIDYSILNLFKLLKKIKFSDKSFRKNNLIRLEDLKKQIKQKELDSNLHILNQKRYYTSQ